MALSKTASGKPKDASVWIATGRGVSMSYRGHAGLLPATRKLSVDNKRDAIGLQEILHMRDILCVFLSIFCQGCDLFPTQLLEQL